jgi:hypothetical protein
MSEDQFTQARWTLNARFKAGEINERELHDARRIIDANEAQARMLAALPPFPQYGFYVKTGLTGYGPDLDESDYPADSWESVATDIASELREMSEFNWTGADAEFESAERLYANDERLGAADTYHSALTAHMLSRELDIMAQNFANLANADNPAPLYAGRPELRHARIWNLITENFPLDVSYNSRLYVWECEEAPDTEED